MGAMKGYLPLLGAIAAIAVPGCRPDTKPLVICHNANCVEPANPDEDDTAAALTASLALQDDDDVPLIDGVEIDTFWNGAEARCLFAHDLAGSDEPDAVAAVDVINAHLSERFARGAPLTHSGESFMLFVELKGHVGEAKSDKHSDEEQALHAGCAVDVFEAFAGPAVAEARPARVVFTSFEPALLGAVQDALDARAVNEPLVPVRLTALFGIPPPLDSQTLPIADFGDVDLGGVSIHPQWTRTTSQASFDSLGLDVGYWMFSAVPETLAAIDAHQPSFVTTSEATFMRRWLDR